MNVYVLFVLGKSENRIKEYINKHTFHEAIVPVVVKLLKRKATVIREEKILFPGYVFVRSELQTQTFKAYAQQNLYNLPGFIKILSYKESELDALSLDEIRFLQPFFKNKGEFEFSIGFIEDDQVVITSGPLVGLESKIININRHKKQARLQVTLFNEIKEINVSLEILSKLT